jgi:allantoinase
MIEGFEGPVGLKSRRVLLHDDDGPRFVPAVVWVEGGRIVAIQQGGDEDRGLVEDYGDLCLLPGLVDTHVHINEPGRTEWEGFTTATKAAALGGITTIVDMPLNCIPVTTTAEALAIKLEAARPLLYVDAGFWGGVVPGNAGELGPLAAAGMLGAKAFTCHSGIDDFPASDRATLAAAMGELAKAGVPLLVHAELESPVPDDARAPTDYQRFLASRPKQWEDDAIAMVIELVRETGCAAHIVHLSSASALEMLASARAEGLPITAETCPHYLCLVAEEVPEGDTAFKCCPPIREASNREALWQGLLDGHIDAVVSDHSPCTPHLKLPERGDFMDAWGGIASLQLGLRTMWWEAQRRGVPLAQLVDWMTRRTATIAGLSQKGRIEVGCDADLVAFDPDVVEVVDPSTLAHRHKVTPYAGREARGRVRHTWLRGEQVVLDGAVWGEPRGEALLGRNG